MFRRFSAPLRVIGLSFGFGFLGIVSVGWGQTCPALQGCTNTIPSDADYATIGGLRWRC